MEDIKSAVVIKAPVKDVWDVITDLKQYRNWNSQFSVISGKARSGGRLKMKYSPLYYRTFTTKPVIHHYEHLRTFGWKGMTMFPGLLDGEYHFTVTAIDPNTTQLHFHQEFKGLLAVFVPRMNWLSEARKSCIKMNAEIKKRVEFMVKDEQKAPALSA